jgi:[ribosomal protein S5]-alanine N-acetyltransferase
MEIETKRLILNSFQQSDAVHVAKLAGDIKVVEMTASIPYPYEVPMAQSWIATHQKQKEDDHNYIFAIRLKETQELVGCMNIGFNQNHDRGYLGYWIGYDFWGKGYATEALREVIKFGFSFENVNKIWAEHKSFNAASGRVMEKVGMKHEGIMREHYKQSDGVYLDMSVKSILRKEYFKII